ncbi:hypothetical protein TKK_0008731 [Trichogramma kaykai]
MDSMYQQNLQDIQFLDFSDLDNHTRNELVDLLRPNNETSEGLKLPWPVPVEQQPIYQQPMMYQTVPETHEETPKLCYPYEVDPTFIKYENQATNQSSLYMPVPNMMQYTQQVMPVYQSEWQHHINNMPTEPQNYLPYNQELPGMYIPYSEHREMPPMRENNGRRRGSGRQHKNYSRNMNHNTQDIQNAFINEHNQYAMGLPAHPSYMYMQEQQVAHPAPNHPVFYPPQTMYQPLTQPNHRVEYMSPVYHPPSTHKFNRQSNANQMNGDAKVTNHKSYDRKIQKQSNLLPEMQIDVQPNVLHDLQSEMQLNLQQDLQQVAQRDVPQITCDVQPIVQQDVQRDVQPIAQTDSKSNVHLNVQGNVQNSSAMIIVNADLPLTENCRESKNSLNPENSLPKSEDNCSKSEATDDTLVINKNNKFLTASTVEYVEQNNKEVSDLPAAALSKEQCSITDTKITDHKEASVLVEPKLEQVKEEKKVQITGPQKTEKTLSDKNNEVPATVETKTSSEPPKPAFSWAELVKKPNGLSGSENIHSKPAPLVNSNVNKASIPPDVNDKNKTIRKNVQQTKRQTENTERVQTENKPKPISTPTNLNDKSSKHYDEPISYRMGEFLLTYELNKQTVSFLPRGLTNRSNYCYINSILQALLACPPFYNLLMAMPYNKSMSKNSRSPLIDNMIKFAREFSPLPEGARLGRRDRTHKKLEDAADIQSGVPFEPSYIYSTMRNTSTAGSFSVEGRQEDAEEFLSCLLNNLGDEMLELMKLADNNEQKPAECTKPTADTATSDNPEDPDEWKIMGPKNKGSITRSTDFGRTPLSDIFRGQIRSRVSRGAELSDYVQPFYTLQLEIEKADSVKTALELLVGKDPLEGMTCSKTKQKIEAWKQVTLEDLPVILILHLKWFDYNLDGCSKILKSVEFPIDLKIDSKIMSAPARPKLNSKQKQYKLFAVTYHDGKEATKGHYITDAFHVGYGGWVRYDDSSLKGVSEFSVLNPQSPRVPYLLYYRRCDTIGNSQTNISKTR